MLQLEQSDKDWNGGIVDLQVGVTTIGMGEVTGRGCVESKDGICEASWRISAYFRGMLLKIHHQILDARTLKIDAQDSILGEIIVSVNDKGQLFYKTEYNLKNTLFKHAAVSKTYKDSLSY